MKGHYCSDIATKTRASDQSRIRNPSTGLISLRRRFSFFGMRAIGLFFWVCCARMVIPIVIQLRRDGGKRGVSEISLRERKNNPLRL